MKRLLTLLLLTACTPAPLQVTVHRDCWPDAHVCRITEERRLWQGWPLTDAVLAQVLDKYGLAAEATATR